MNDKNPESILERWGVSEEQLTELVDNNPSLRGMMLGYVAENKFHDLFLDHPEITEVGKDDDHNRKKKGDRFISYKGEKFVIEVKSLQTAMCKKLGEDQWSGKSQVDGSDRRVVKFPDGSELNTTLLLKGEFDILAVNCFAFGEKWRFAFAKNKDLPTSTYKKYSEEQQQKLIASLVPVTWPPEPPFHADPFELLDQLLIEKEETSVSIDEQTEVVTEKVEVVTVEEKS